MTCDIRAARGPAFSRNAARPAAMTRDDVRLEKAQDATGHSLCAELVTLVRGRLGGGIQGG